MPAQPRSTRHGHQHVPGSAEQWKQADVGPGRTHSSIPTPVLCKTNQQPIPAWFVLRHILCTPQQTAQSVWAQWSLGRNQWPPERLKEQDHPWRPRSIHGLPVLCSHQSSPALRDSGTGRTCPVSPQCSSPTACAPGLHRREMPSPS